MLNGHFLQPVTDNKAAILITSSNDHLQDLLLSITTISVELQERMRTVFLGTPERCHYIFTLRDLSKIFRHWTKLLVHFLWDVKVAEITDKTAKQQNGLRSQADVFGSLAGGNICLSLDGNATSENLLCLWRHECDWVYGHKMVSLVDYRRYEQEYVIAAKKVLTNEEQLHLILSPRQPLFSNIIEDEGGLITTSQKQQEFSPVKRNEKASSQLPTLDGYHPTFDMPSVEKLLREAVREYNKANPRMSITFYKNTVEHLCRLTRNLWSPHESAHTMLCGEGCPKLCVLLVRLAAHLCGFSVVQVGSPPTEENTERKAEHFKMQLVDSYINAGLKGQHTVLMLTEEEANKAALVYMMDFVVSGSVSHLFSSEQQAAIANAMRSEVTSAGLTYSKESAWNFFLQSVQQNFRWILIYTSIGPSFYQKCLEFPSLINALNVYFIPHWSREYLVAHADHHIQHLEVLTKKEKENVCHLLASMHLAVASHDRSQCGRGEHGHLTNATFETFVQCFADLMKSRYQQIMEVHDLVKKVLTYTECKMRSYTELANNLQQQMLALEEHKQGTLQILVQIAQDKVVVEQKIHSVQQHLKKIKGFQKLLPEYQLALEKAEYKASAIIADIKRLVKDMDIGALGELRGMQKPDVDTEELMASIIIILKSPNTDLTWSKGAKRQMANIDRFLNELSSFDKIQVSASTLELLESNIKKSSFTVENMERKAGGNAAAGTLLKWLQRAVRFYRIKASKVKPLNSKVEEMKVALEEAEQKMKSLQQKKDALIARLHDLEKSFEDATVDKSNQEQKTIEISQKLAKAGTLIQLLEVENNKYTQIIGSLPDRLSSLPGSTAIAAGFVSYLGAYEHLFRQLILTVDWPQALKERGLPLIIDSIDPMKGRVIDFAVQFFWEEPEREIRDAVAMQEVQECNDNPDAEASELKLEDLMNDQQFTEVPSSKSLQNSLSLPIISEEHYREYMEALLKIIVKESEIQELIVRDWTQQEMENAAILHFTWQRPPLLIDPCYEGRKWFDAMQESSDKMAFTSVTLKTRQNNSILGPIEKAISTGCNLVLYNYSKKWDHLLKPLIDHCSALSERTAEQGVSDILSFNGHRLLCSDQFKPYLVASQDSPQLSAEMSSGTTIINCSPCEDSLREALLHRAFASIQPELHCELQKVTKAFTQQQDALEQLEKTARDCFISCHTNDTDNTDRMTAVFNRKQEISAKLQDTRSLRNKLLQVRNRLLPLASRGALLFSTLKALEPLATEYQFSLESFLQLFDKAIGTRDATMQRDDKTENPNEDSLFAPPPPPSQLDVRSRDSFGDQPQDGNGLRDILTASHGLELPTSGVQYLSLPANQIIESMEQLTNNFYQTMTQSLLPEHTLLAYALLCFQIQQQGRENLFSDDELAFLVQGSSAYGNMALTMADMGSDVSPPPWLPSDRWEDLLVLSMVPGPLSSLCLEIAGKSSLWEEWYKSDYPDLEKLPCEITENKDPIIKLKDENESMRPLASPDRSSYSEFHKLLILRAMRPDRIPDALSQYVKKNVGDLVLNGAGPDIEAISNLAENTLGILVLLQQQQCSSQAPSYESTVINLDPTHAICRAAKERSIPVCVISMKNGSASEIKASLDDTLNQDGWLIIENLHLASKTAIEDLHQNMLYAKKMKEPQKQDSHFCVWLTTEPGGLIPQQLLTSLKKVSWHVFVPKHITKMAVLGPLTSLESPALLMQVAILSALDEVNDELYVKLKAMPLNTRIICFGVCILHGILIVQRALPGTGLNHLLTVGHVQLNQAIKAVIDYSQKFQTTQADLSQVLEDRVSTVYTNLTTRSEDVVYIQALTHNIFSQCQQQSDSFDIGGLTIPVPSANVEPQQYSSWLSEKFPEGFSVGEPLLPRRIERASNEAHGTRYLQSLSDMLNAMQVGFPPANPQRQKSAKEMFSLRRALDIISEQLPPPLEVGSFNTDASSYLSPYHRATDARLFSEDKKQPPETIGYCLLQECYWMNALMCHIRKQVNELSKCMVAGSFAVPDHLNQSARALKKGEVPKDWLHPHCWPTAHTVLSWLADLQQKHIQLKQWLKKGLMPFANGDKGALNAVRPGGLVNPEALFIALRYEYALQHGHLMDEVILHCQISEYPDYKPEAQGYQLYLEGLYLQNATWDFRQNHLKESRDELVPLPFVTVTPAYYMDGKFNEEEMEIYECPLYLDNTKQFCVTKIPLPCPKPAYQWHLQRVAIILNPELDAFFPPKWNSFMNARVKERRHHTMAMNTRALTDRSFYSKLFHPPSDWMFYEDIQPLTLNPDTDTDNVLDLQEIGSAKVKDKLGSQVENTDGSMDLQEDRETKEIINNLMLLSPSSNRETFDTAAAHGDTIDYHNSHQISITDNLLDLQGIGSAFVKDKLESQVEDTDYAMDLQEDRETLEITDTLMLLSPSSNQETFDTGADHSDSIDYHNSHQDINGTTSGNNYQGGTPETEFESHRNLSLERDQYAKSGRGQEALVDNDHKEVTEQKSSSLAINDDYNEEGFEKVDYAEGYMISDDNRDTREEVDRNLGNDHGDVNYHGETANKSMNDENNLNINADGQDDDDIYADDDDFGKPGSNLADPISLRNSAVSYEKEFENDVLDRGLGNDVDHEIRQTKGNSFLGLLSESGSDRDSENDYNF